MRYPASGTPGLTSITTEYTITKIRSATKNGENYIVASGYDGQLVGIAYDGRVLWKNLLSGFLNHDIWADDINGDGDDEIFAANADGKIYAIDHSGEKIWDFSVNSAPMHAVTTIRNKDNNILIVAGGFDKNIYYLDKDGTLIKTVSSKSYSEEKAWGAKKDGNNYNKTHIANFLRPLPTKEGYDRLLVQGVAAHIVYGAIYEFEPLAESPRERHSLAGFTGFPGSFRFGENQVLIGAGGNHAQAGMHIYDLENKMLTFFDIEETNNTQKLKNHFGYRTSQAELVNLNSEDIYFILFGHRIYLAPTNLSPTQTEIIESSFAFNDMWKDKSGEKILLASTQSGGSAVHIINIEDPNWKPDFKNLAPPGKIASMKESFEEAKQQLAVFAKPSWERMPKPVYPLVPKDHATTLNSLNRSSPIGIHRLRKDPKREKTEWRSSPDTYLDNEKYRNRLDGRMTYSLTQDEVLAEVIPEMAGHEGIAYWAGHGNDPYMYQRSTSESVIKSANGKMTVLIWPEIYGSDSSFDFVLNDLFYPLGEYAGPKNGKIYFRSKAPMWFSVVHLPQWKGFLSGNYSQSFIAAHEETGAKIADLSIPGRYGLWASGVVKDLGARAVPDMVRYHGMRTHCDQHLGNYYLRYNIYNIAQGTRFLNNHALSWHQEYIDFLYELLGSGALYVPDKDEILSYSPVHLSMIDPDPRLISEVNNLKWSIYFDQDDESANPMVFSRINDSWPAAPVTEWDFSRYAAGVKDRRVHFLPPYNNGLVLITPPQHGIYKDSNAVRPLLADNIHPIYENILTEYYTDGRQYYSADGTESFPADTYYQIVEKAIVDGAKKLPLTVDGKVAWVTAQTAPKHLRLTLIDSGFLSPENRVAIVNFHSVKPVKITDLLSGEEFELSKNNSASIEISAGMFRFIDIEISDPLGPTNRKPYFSDKDGKVSKSNASYDENYSDTLINDAEDPDDDSLIFRKLTGPSWLKITTDGHLEGTPSETDIGLNTFTVSVKDLQGASSEATIYITVDSNPEKTHTVYANTDAFVRNGEGYSNSNTGSYKELRVATSNSPKWTYQSFLQFNLDQMSTKSIQKAYLKIKVDEAKSVGDIHSVSYVEDDSWSESTITWNNKPAVSTTISNQVVTTDETWVSFDISDAVIQEHKGDQILSLALISNGGTTIKYYSSESTQENSPKLVIITE